MSLLTKSTSGATFLILVQFITKLLTFLLNQILIRYISPKSFGLSSYLEFLVSTVLFFSREGERLSIQRTETSEIEDEDHDGKITKRGVLQSIINFGFLPLIIGVPLSLAIFYWQFHSELFKSTLLQLGYYKYTIGFIWVAIILELLIEPIYAINQFELNFKRRSQFEGVAVFNKCISTFCAITIFKRHHKGEAFEGLAILAFALGQFSYSATLFVRYFWSFIQDNLSKPPHQKLHFSIKKIQSEKSSYYFDSKIFSIWKSLFIQMIFKQFLTEGDKILINYLCTVEEQGVYSVVTNYGSIIARLILQPIEESVRLLFTRLLSSGENKKSISESYYLMKYLSVFYLNLSILIILGGFTNASYLLKFVLGGDVWSKTNVFEIFPQYVLYIPFLAFNGILEALFSSIATEKDIQRFSYFMTLLSVVVLVSLYVSIEQYKMGLSGLILSNGINMSLRIGYCYFAIKAFYGRYSTHINIKGLLSYVKYPLGIAIILEFIQYKVILRESFKTVSAGQFVKSVSVCLVGFFGLCYIEREVLLTKLKSLRSKQA